MYLILLEEFALRSLKFSSAAGVSFSFIFQLSCSRLSHFGTLQSISHPHEARSASEEHGGGGNRPRSLPHGEGPRRPRPGARGGEGGLWSKGMPGRRALITSVQGSIAGQRPEVRLIICTRMKMGRRDLEEAGGRA